MGRYISIWHNTPPPQRAVGGLTHVGLQQPMASPLPTPNLYHTAILHSPPRTLHHYKVGFGLSFAPRTETCGVLANKEGTRQHNKILVSGTIGAFRLCSDNRISCGPKENTVSCQCHHVASYCALLVLCLRILNPARHATVMS